VSASARQAILDHVRLWNEMDKDAWLALFADDVVYEDPPGTVTSRGKQVMSDHAWDGSFNDTKRWILEACPTVNLRSFSALWRRKWRKLKKMESVAALLAALIAQVALELVGDLVAGR
jgi:hypothetical protein